MVRFLHHESGLAILMALGIVALSFVTLQPSRAGRDETLKRDLARVVAVDNSGVQVHGIVRTEEQILRVRLLSGPHRGTELEAINFLSGKLELDEFYCDGQTIFVEYGTRTGQPSDARPRGVLRLHWQLALVLLFGALLLAIAGWTGLNAVLSFVFSALVLWRVFFPLLLRGWPPLLTGLGVAMLLTAVITLAIGGLNRRGWVAFSGAMLGLLLTCGLAMFFTRAFQIHGAIRPFAETLIYSGYIHLDLTRIFIASVVIGSSGAVMDLAMDIATAMEEIKRHHPTIGRLEHVRSGMRVGRAVIGTMTTTLLLAYSGSHITMFMLFIAKGMPLTSILNSPMVAGEVLNTLVGSFGLITVAPFTALVGGLLYHRRLP